MKMGGLFLIERLGSGGLLLNCWALGIRFLSSILSGILGVIASVITGSNVFGRTKSILIGVAAILD